MRLFGRLAFLGIVGLAMVVLVSQSGGKAAQATIAQSCPAGEGGGGGVTVSFVWPAAGEGAIETWLEVGLNGEFTPASYQSYGPFDPGQTAYALAALPEGVRYHYRTQAKTSPEGGTAAGTEWKTIAKGAFTAACGKPAAPISAAQRCIEGPEPGPADDGVAALFAWAPGTEGEQWIDVSADGDGFAPGTYEGHGPAASGATTLEVSPLARGARYWWRVNVRTPGGWIASVPASFETLECARVSSRS